MSIATAEDLNNNLSSDLAWRKKELSILKGAILSSKSSLVENSLVRSGVALLYAHWEGFIKISSRMYLEYIGKRKLPYNQLSRNVIAIRISQILNQISSKSKVSECLNIVDFFLDGLVEKCNTPYKNAIDTESNLSSKVLKEIILTLNFDYSLYETKEKMIDEQLVSKRNEIAHGQYLLMSVNDYFQLEFDIVSLMSLFYNQVDNAATQKIYLRV
jgi:hypothetical protein